MKVLDNVRNKFGIFRIDLPFFPHFLSIFEWTGSILGEAKSKPFGSDLGEVSLIKIELHFLSF